MDPPPNITAFNVTDCPDSLYCIGDFIRSKINVYISACVVPFGVLIGLLNNSAVIFIFIFGKQVPNQVLKTVRIYSICLALGDINLLLGLYLTYFLGVQFNFTNSLIFKNKFLRTERFNYHLYL